MPHTKPPELEVTTLAILDGRSAQTELSMRTVRTDRGPRRRLRIRITYDQGAPRWVEVPGFLCAELAMAATAVHQQHLEDRESDDGGSR